jgi:hypothetical protein
MNKTSIIILLLGGVILGCQTKNQDRKDDVALRAYRLIDDQRTDEAIELLETELREDSSNKDLKVTLASAYAHKGGIKIQKLASVVGNVDTLNKSKRTFIDIGKQKTMSEQTNATVMNASTMLLNLAQVFDAYAAIPVINRDQASYVRHAIMLLNEIKNSDLKPEDVLYRLVLEVVMLKHFIAENLLGDFAPPKNKKNECKLDLEKVNQNFVALGKLLLDIYNDIGFVRPKSATEMKKLSNDTSDAISNATIFFTSAAVLDDAAKTFLNESVVQSGFGKLIRCGGD